MLLIYMVKMDSDSLESAKMIKMFPWLRFSLNLIHLKKNVSFSVLNQNSFIFMISFVNAYSSSIQFVQFVLFSMLFVEKWDMFSRVGV